MKTLRLTIVSVFFTLLVAGTVNAGNSGIMKNHFVVNISLTQAVQNPELVAAMYQQINSGFLNVNRLLYTVNIKFEGYIVRISGTYEQWQLFFNHWKIVGANTFSFSDVSPN